VGPEETKNFRVVEVTFYDSKDKEGKMVSSTDDEVALEEICNTLFHPP